MPVSRRSSRSPGGRVPGRLRWVQSGMERTENPNRDLARRVGGGVNALPNPFQGAPVAVGEIHERLADGLRIEPGVEGQSEGPGSQTLLEHAEPHAETVTQCSVIRQLRRREFPDYLAGCIEPAP